MKKKAMKILKSDGFQPAPEDVSTLLLLTFLTIILFQWDFFHEKFGLLPHGESQLRQSRATQLTMHA